MVEKIEVRVNDNGGRVMVTRCDGGGAWVEVRRADGTTPGIVRLTMSERTDLALALDQGLTTREEATNLREKYNQACKSSVLNAEEAYRLSERIKELESGGHGAYQKLNDELAKTKAQVASLQGQVTGRGAALETWKREAELRAEDHERVNAVAKVFQCPSYDVVGKAEILVKAYAEARTREADGDTRVVNTSETWKERDARHRETIHQLKQENANFRRNANAGREERDALKRQLADRTRPHYVEVSPVNPPVSSAEAAHVMSLTKQLEDAQTMHRFCDSRRDGWIQTCQTWKAKYDKQCAKVEELEKAGKILAEAMQEWRSKLTAECGFTYPNLVNLGDIVKEVRRLKEARQLSDPRVALLESERDGLKDTLGHWRKDLAEVLGLDSPKVWSFVTFIMKIRELKASASVSVQLRKDFENKHREACTANSEYNRMLELRRGDQETVKRCSDRVKELEQRCFDIEAIATGRKP